VRPGLTGWAQVHGRNAIPWDRKFELDVWYVRHVSLALDLEILARTLLPLVRREGIAAEGHATTPEFTGGAYDSRTGGTGR
jgi:lipopolysaccharide/colanic/teichoic acid biosynthesis glycosyltransferase